MALPMTLFGEVMLVWGSFATVLRKDGERDSEDCHLGLLGAVLRLRLLALAPPVAPSLDLGLGRERGVL